MNLSYSQWFIFTPQLTSPQQCFSPDVSTNWISMYIATNRSQKPSSAAATAVMATWVNIKAGSPHGQVTQTQTT